MDNETAVLVEEAGMTPNDKGPTLQEYVETRFNLFEEAMKSAHAATDLRYQQRFEAQSDALAAAFLSQQTAMQTALQAAKEAVQAALAAADRGVSKAELAADKRFESVNEFRSTLSDQQRTFIPREEVIVMNASLFDKITTLKEQVDHLNAERMGVKGGYGYAVGVVGFVLTILAIIGWIMSRAGE